MMCKNICNYICSSILSKIKTSVLLKNIFSLYKSQKPKREVSMAWYDLVSYHFALFMASKTKTASFHDLRTLFLVLLLRFWLQNQSDKFLCLNKRFAPRSFAWFMAITFKRRIFWDLIKTLFLVLLLRLWLQKKPKPEVSITW